MTMTKINNINNAELISNKVFRVHKNPSNLSYQMMLETYLGFPSVECKKTNINNFDAYINKDAYYCLGYNPQDI